VADETVLRELLESPLDESGSRPRPAWPRAVAVAVGVAIVGGMAVWLTGSEAVPGTTSGTGIEQADVQASDPGVSDSAGRIEAPADTVATEPVMPEAGRFQELVTLGGGQVLAFGGFVPLDGGTAPLEGTWRFDVTTGEWEQDTADPAPSPRFGHAMALHPPTDTVVLFGGGTTVPRPCPRTRFCTGPEDNQVWHFDPATGEWSDRTPPVTEDREWPTSRFGARLAYEPITEQLILFGGVGVFGERFTPTFYEETWAYDPVSGTWEDLTTNEQPPGRTAFGMGWNEGAARLMMFGGDGLSGTDDDRLWAFDPKTGTWEDLGASETGPHDRWFHGVVADPQSGRLVVLGGTGSVFTPIQGGTLRDVGVLDEVWTWSEAEGWTARSAAPSPISPVVAVADAATATIVVSDGSDVLGYDPATDDWSVLFERPEEG